MLFVSHISYTCDEKVCFQTSHLIKYIFSLSNRAYVATLPRDVPVQVLAVTGSSSAASIIFHKPDATYLLNDDTKLSSKLLQQQTALNQGL